MTSVHNNKPDDPLAGGDGSGLQAHARETEDALLSGGGVQMADAKPLSRVRLLLSRTRLLDFFKKSPRLLARRPFVVVSYVPAGDAPLCSVLHVTTKHDRAERAAVVIEARYYTLFGRKITVEPGRHAHSLFADPQGQVIAQPCYFNSPVKARWVCLTMRRQTRERRIIVQGSLRPKAGELKPLSHNEVLTSRDDLQLRQHLDKAFTENDRAKARKILERLIFLRQMPDDRQTLRVIADVDDVLAQPHKPIALTPDKKEGAYQYGQLFMTPYQGGYPLSKWLIAEAQHLRAAVADMPVCVADAPYVSLRLMAAVYAGAVLSDMPATEKLDHVPWMSVDDVRLFCEGGKTTE